MYKNEKFSFKLMISVNGYTEKPTSKDYNKISFEEKEITRKKQNLIMVIVFTPTEYVKLKTGTGVEKNSF